MTFCPGARLALSLLLATLPNAFGKQLQSLHRLVGCLRLKNCSTLLACAQAIFIGSELWNVPRSAECLSASLASDPKASRPQAASIS